MAEEIARDKRVNVRRPEREWLLEVRAGEFSYEELVARAEEKIQLIDDLFRKSDLPEHPEVTLAEKALVEIREFMY